MEAIKSNYGEVTVIRELSKIRMLVLAAT